MISDFARIALALFVIIWSFLAHATIKASQLLDAHNQDSLRVHALCFSVLSGLPMAFAVFAFLPERSEACVRLFRPRTHTFFRSGFSFSGHFWSHPFSLLLPSHVLLIPNVFHAQKPEVLSFSPYCSLLIPAPTERSVFSLLPFPLVSSHIRTQGIPWDKYTDFRSTGICFSRSGLPVNEK